jgi:hypothetical protein
MSFYQVTTIAICCILIGQHASQRQAFTICWIILAVEAGMLLYGVPA